MKKLMLAALLVVLGSCTKNKDPFSDLDLKSMSRKEFVSKLIDDKVLTEPDEDSITFRYFLTEGESKIPLEVSIYDQYNFGKVRKFEIGLGGDEKYSQSDDICRGCAPRSKPEVDKIFRIYMERYGEPDSLMVKPKMRFKSPWGALNGEKPSIIDKSIPPSRRAIWQTNNFDLIFETGYPVKKPGSNQFVYDGSYDSDARIIYRMKGYDQEMKRLSDSIRKTLRPNDLFMMDVSNPDWYDANDWPYNARCIFRLGSIVRKDREEPKRVKAIRYDIVVTDVFKKELYRITDQTFEFKTPIANMTPTGVEIVATNQQYIIRYNSLNSNSKALVEMRKYDERNIIHTNVDIRTVLFEDGSQLRDSQ